MYIEAPEYNMFGILKTQEGNKIIGLLIKIRILTSDLFAREKQILSFCQKRD